MRFTLVLVLALVLWFTVFASPMDGGVLVEPAVARAESLPGEWTSHRGSPEQRGVAEGQLADELELVWSVEVGGAVTSSPVVQDGIVYFGSDDQHLWALDAETGEERWSFATEDIIEAPPLLLGGKVYIGSSDFYIYCLDAKSGEEVWRVPTDDKILGAVNWFEGAEGVRLVVGSYDTRVYCLDPADGSKQWVYVTENYVNGTPAIERDRIVFGGCDAYLHVVSGATGEALQKVLLGEGCHVAGSVGVEDGKAYFGHYGNAFVCIDLATGEEVWSYEDERHPFFSAPAIGAERVVFGGRDKALHCVNKADGAPLWAFPTRRKVDASPTICGDKVVFGSGDGNLFVVGLDDGVERWSYEIGRSIFTSPAIVDGRVYVGANDSRLYCFGPKAADQVAEDDR